MIEKPRIGVYGGTFDPPHIAHFVAAERVAEQLQLDRMLIVVANEPWQKVGERPVTPAPVRWEMVQRCVEASALLEASDIEMVRGGPTYSVDTLRSLHEAEPTAELFLVLGADAFAGLGTWKEPAAVRELATLVVVTRSGHDAAPTLDEGDLLVEIPSLDVASSDLRARVAEGRSIRYLVPDGVVPLVERHGLYRGDR